MKTEIKKEGSNQLDKSQSKSLDIFRNLGVNKSMQVILIYAARTFASSNNTTVESEQRFIDHKLGKHFNVKSTFIIEEII